MSADIYDIRKYSDEECYRVLGFTSSPSDMELEQTLLQQIKKYSSIHTINAQQLQVFFQSMYDHFFEDEDEDEDQESSYEGFQTQGQSKPVDNVQEYDFTNVQTGTSISNDDVNIPNAFFRQNSEVINTNALKENETFNEDGIVVSTNSGEESKGVFGAQRIITKDIDYTPGQLNPIMKETIKRTININSQDRDEVFEQNSSLTTDFQFYLEETLKNVVSMKLYAVQIPYTWYTIDDTLGSNILFIKSDTPGLQGDKHQYKIEIEAGNYKPNTLVSAVNTSFQELQTNNPDVNFNNSGFSFNNTNARCTFELDIEKIYDTKEFQMNFGSSNVEDNSYNNLETYLGFTENGVYNLNQHHSYVKTIRNNANNFSVLEQIKIVRYSVEFDTNSGKMLDISRNIQSNGLLPNEEELLDIIVSGGESPSTISETLNGYIQGSSYLTGNVSYDNNTWNWNLDYNREAGYPLLYQKLAIRIDTSSNIDFFGFTSHIQDQISYPKYINVNSFDISGGNISPYEYVIETSTPVVSAGLYDTSGMSIILYNETARRDFGLSDLSFVDMVDVRILIDFSNNFEVVDLIRFIGNEFLEKSITNTENYRITNPNTRVDLSNVFVLKDELTGNDYFIFDLDISFVLQGSNQVFDLSGIDGSSNGIVFDFSGLLYDVYLFRTKDTTYDISSTLGENFGIIMEADVSYAFYNSSGIYPRTTVDICSNTYTYTYTSIHPELASQYSNNDQYVIRLKGNNLFPNLDLSFNLNDLSGQQLQSITTNLKNKLSDEGENIGVFIDFQTENLGLNTIGSYGYDINTITTNNSYYQIAATNTLYKSTLTISIIRTFILQDYEIRFEGNLWNSVLQLDYSYNGYELINNRIEGGILDYNNRFIGNNQTINFNSILSSEIIGVNTMFINVEQEININTEVLSQQGFLISDLIDKINGLYKENKNLYGTYMEIFEKSDGKKYIRLYINIARTFTTNDYRLVLYDSESFEQCNKSSNYFRTSKSNTTLGYILGFRSLTEYEFTSENFTSTSTPTRYFDTYTNRSTNPQNNFYRQETILNSGLTSGVNIRLTSDTVVSVSLYNSLMIVLEDYNQSHMNDGLVTVTQRDTKASLPYYALRNIYSCNPETNEVLNSGLNGKNLTSKQIYSLNQIINAQNTTQSNKKKTTSLKDIFAIVPVKYGLSAGDIFVEFGGTLQAQERTYFGPVNISRLRVKLLTDKGDVINLNGADWSFQIICETLYKQPTSE